MLPDLRRDLCATVAALSIVGVAAAAAQTTVRLRFDPNRRGAVEMRTTTDGIVAYDRIGDGGDSARAEWRAAADIVRQALVPGVDSASLRFVYGPVSAAYRWGGNEWHAVDAAAAVRLDAVTGPRLTMPSIVVEDPAAAVALGVSAFPHVTVPGREVAVAERWRENIVLPFALAIAADQTGNNAGTVTGTLVAPAVFQMDSLTVRGADTLAYLRLGGRFDPQTVASDVTLGGAPAPVELWGELSGELVWSTGWNAFASGVVRWRVHQRYEAPLGSGIEDMRVTITAVTRLVVRP